MTTTQQLRTPLPVGSSIIPGTLRAKLEEVRAQGRALSLSEAVAILVPLTVAIAERHAAGQMLYLHPSSVVLGPAGGYSLSPELAASPPVLPRDKACIAPEQRGGNPGDARASVFALGAMLYELVTGEVVGPGMRRPTEVNPSLPPALEVLLSKALVGDPGHRPDDLYALAQATHHLAPGGSIAPPPADESHLDRDEGFAVDVSLSMLPPAPVAHARAVVGAASPYDVMVKEQVRPPPNLDDDTSQLAELKARLESDTRPRYVVVKDGMDHGPFNAVELLQQIASHTFVQTDVLRDNFSQDFREIKDWQEFAPFAEHARRHRDIKAEKQALERSVVQESRSTTGKALFGLVIVGALLAAAAVWFFAVRGRKSDEIAVHGDTVTNVETDAGLNVPTRRRRGGRGGVVGRSGNFPLLGGGMSCEAAQAAYVEEYKIGAGSNVPADLSANQYGAVLNRGTYFSHCGVPDSMSVTICAAVQNGRAVGVSVYTQPNNARIRGCVAAAVRGLAYPSHPRLDVTRTTFAAQ
jgi:hypothetical protein